MTTKAGGAAGSVATGGGGHGGLEGSGGISLGGGGTGATAGSGSGGAGGQEDACEVLCQSIIECRQSGAGGVGVGGAGGLGAGGGYSFDDCTAECDRLFSTCSAALLDAFNACAAAAPSCADLERCTFILYPCLRM